MRTGIVLRRWWTFDGLLWSITWNWDPRMWSVKLWSRFVSRDDEFAWEVRSFALGPLWIQRSVEIP